MITYSNNKKNMIVKLPSLEFKLVKVQGGTFTMGEGKKAHKVELDTFYMAEFPVTQELYEAVMKTNPSKFKGKRRPVETVNWYKSVEFCQKINEILELPQGSDDKAKLDLKTKGFRLPTEAEWEYAAGGGARAEHTKQEYAGSNNLNIVGWYSKNANSETRPVGLKMPNKLGLYDMSGNVYEWCWDWSGKDSKYRVLRGGSWCNDATRSRIAFRNYDFPNFVWNDFGFRLVFSL